MAVTGRGHASIFSTRKMEAAISFEMLVKTY
jgi:hypothetical protein